MTWPALVLLSLDLVGVFFFAVSGCLLAARRGFDLTGGLILAIAAGLGGGILRDVTLGEVPRTLQNPAYILPPVIAAVAVYLLADRLLRVRHTIVVFDAAGLGLFVLTGTVIALEAGLPTPSAILLGTLSGIGGGMLRDIAANEVPAVFTATDLYAIPGVAGAGLTALVWHLDLYGLWSGLAIAALVFTIRMLAWRYAWRGPHSMRSWRVRRANR